MPLIPAAGAPKATQYLLKGRHLDPVPPCDISIWGVWARGLRSIDIRLGVSVREFLSVISAESRLITGLTLLVLLPAVPLLWGTAIGEGVAPEASPGGDHSSTNVFASYFEDAPAATRPPSRQALQPSLLPSPRPTPAPTPALAPPPAPAPIAVPLPEPSIPPPPLPAQPVETPVVVWELCPDAVGLNVIDAELTGAVQAGVNLLSEYFGCQRFRIDGSGVTIRFGDITPMFNARILGYAHSAPDAYEIWLNPDCWGVVEDWAGVVAHELGHYLGWRHGDDHPYMWLAPPGGSYAQTGDAAIVCY